MLPSRPRHEIPFRKAGRAVLGRHMPPGPVGTPRIQESLGRARVTETSKGIIAESRPARAKYGFKFDT